MKGNSAFTSSSTQFSPDTTISRPLSNCLESLDELIGFSNYDRQFIPGAGDSASLETLPLLQSNPTGSIHDYDLYRQQAGTFPTAIANTLTMNQLQESTVTCQGGGGDEILELQTDPACNTSHNSSDIDIEFESSNSEPAYFNPTLPNMALTNLNAVSDQQMNLPPTQSSDISCLWSAMNQQQLYTEEQQKQELTAQQSRLKTANKGQLQKYSNSNAKVVSPPKDPIVEEKISQLLESIRQSNSENDNSRDHTLCNLSTRSLAKKEEEMDEDERLLASEEGKKLSSKERRQLRNKVSARAFRSRRKEYINQLEEEIAVRINENGDLRAQNKALIEENIRLSDFTRMLISSPSLSGFFDTIAMNPTVDLNVRAFQQQLQKTDQAQLQPNKNVGSLGIQQQKQHQYLGMAVLPESPVNFSMVDLNCEENHSYQPRIFFAQNFPETLLDCATFSCKKRPLSFLFHQDIKVNFPQIKCMPTLEYHETEDLKLSDENSMKKLAVIRLVVKPPLKTPQTSQSKLDLSLFTENSVNELNTLQFDFENEISDIAVRRVNRLLAETETCFKRLSALLQKS